MAFDGKAKLYKYGVPWCQKSMEFFEELCCLLPEPGPHYVLPVRPYAKSGSRTARLTLHASQKAGMRPLESPGTWNWESRYLTGSWLCRCGYGAQPSKHLRIATYCGPVARYLDGSIGRSDSSPSTHTIWVPAACSIHPLHGEKVL
ncbi:hypothetical protein MCOR07_010626 [Pyricularia oryzae]|uniref:Uncharacterized protein n=4 Tax=Pyricularia TaxID=48558 RepID=A0ABQ8ND13_PYRGI|nr:uncharacterized protein MGG_15596 [Pyricularia oryzae 70-15]ELQ42138.1 hypothetical protein OOU_Y34scaffold00228g29 [Pyricularia oryzae Y34]KAH8837213.1 hypothetical protein MCOR01_010850 [Pyricularia oryzae]KAI6295110.1 hypothetical protein MCOR33_007937 [Pyricularia grisea]EHA54063.1 hypothetical protein MGG_15596 [Pyricularia oryzae 70-15]KAI6251999.1 hypothetical protein MCOR19_011377 [Pyricularia oryzae]